MGMTFALSINDHKPGKIRNQSISISASDYDLDQFEAAIEEADATLVELRAHAAEQRRAKAEVPA